jgi:hypothetical protein
MNGSDGDKVFIGIVIGLIIFALFAWASGAGRPKYSSREAYERAVQSGVEPPAEALDAKPDYDYNDGRP